MKRKYLLALAICLTAVCCDQAAKTIVHEKLFPNKRVVLIHNFVEFRYAENPGMAFSLLQDLEPACRTPLFSTITVVAVLIIIHLLRQTPDRSIRLPAAMGFILSGAFGNLIDRFRWGVVVDFIRVWLWYPTRYQWPTFNLADSFIAIGIGLLIIDMLFTGEEDLAPESASPETPAEEGAGEEGAEALPETADSPDQPADEAPPGPAPAGETNP